MGRKTRVRQRELYPAWRADLGTVGWGAAAGSALAVAAWLAAHRLWPGELAPMPAVRAVAVVVPLAMSVQAAFALSPEDDPALELMLSCPRPLSRTLKSRLLIVSALQGSVALAGSLLCLAFAGGDLATLFARWLTPCLWFSGAAVYTTVLTRRGIMGTLLATTLWGGTLLGGDGIVVRWPSFWPLHAYLQPDATPPDIYVLNRIILAVAGLALLAFSARLANDEEHMLGI